MSPIFPLLSFPYLSFLKSCFAFNLCWLSPPVQHGLLTITSHSPSSPHHVVEQPNQLFFFPPNCHHCISLTRIYSIKCFSLVIGTGFFAHAAVHQSSMFKWRNWNKWNWFVALSAILWELKLILFSALVFCGCTMNVWTLITVTMSFWICIKSSKIQPQEGPPPKIHPHIL